MNSEGPGINPEIDTSIYFENIKLAFDNQNIVKIKQ